MEILEAETADGRLNLLHNLTLFDNTLKLSWLKNIQNLTENGWCMLQHRA